MRGGDGVRESVVKRLLEEFARNPCCDECGNPTTKEYAFGYYEYVCSSDFCDWSKRAEVVE
jgi:hypothetical protein